MPPSNPVFISYSHEDRAAAEKLARALTANGQDVWWDQWEIAVGDSLIKKIFSEGIAKASAFVVLLSTSSANSKWVQEELDSATVRRIEDLTRVIPALVGDTPIPAPLRTLRWIDLRTDFEAGVRAIINAVHGVSSKPSLGRPMPHIKNRTAAIDGLSPMAGSVARYILSESDPDSPDTRAFSGKDLVSALDLTAVELNDAVDELEDAGVVTAVNALGTAPFAFLTVEPTYLLFHVGADQLSYDPQTDIREILVATASLDSVSAEQLREITGLPAGRLNRAVNYLRDQGLADVVRLLGTYPFSFARINATRRTRQAADQG